jgi:CHAD domain-containing protein
MLNRAHLPTATLRRYSQRWVRHALRHAPRRAAATPRQVHQLRVAIKRLRTMWRLIRPFVDEARYQQESAALRDAAAALAQARDAHVARLALLSLVHSAPRHASHLRELASQLHAADPPKARRVPMRVILALRQTRVALSAAVAGIESWKQVDELVDRLQRRARRDRRAADKHRHDGEAFHDFRKRCKDVYYALEMLPPRRRAKLAKLRRTLRSANALLGHDHDLVILRAILVEPGRVKDIATAAKAVRVIDKRLTGLRRQTLKLTRKL